MKRYVYTILSAVMVMIALTGCIDHGFDELDTYSNANIESVNGVFYRWKTSSTDPLTGEPLVRQVQLSRVSQEIDADAATCTYTATPATNFPEDQLSSLSISNLVVVLNISTAATITPIQGSPALGVPADWSQPHMYRIKAADGSYKDWTVTIRLQK